MTYHTESWRHIGRSWRSPSICPLVLAGFLLGIAGPARSVDLATNNVVVVIDGSGSMSSAMQKGSQDRMSTAKEALIEVLRQVPADTQIGLLAFGDIPGSNPWIFPLGPRDDEQIQKKINSINPSGGTPLGDYIKRGADRLLEERTKQHGYGTYRLLVVTDGEATDQWKVDAYTPEVISRGITMDAIGVDMSTAHTLATMVHSYRSADDSASLKKAVADVFAEVAVSGTDQADGDAFAELAPLPFETATALLEALTSSGNHPIGTNPSAATAPQDPSGSTVPVPNLPVPISPKPADNSSSSQENPPTAIYGLGFLVLLMFLMGMSGGNKKKRKG